MSAPVVGFKRLICDSRGRLISGFNRERWDGPTKHASCWRSKISPSADGRWANHGPPASRGCSCGIYALSELHLLPSLFYEYDGFDAVVLVKGWGHGTLAANGWRMEYARILALLEQRAERTRVAAERYGVPLLNPDELKRYARWHARSVQEIWVDQVGEAAGRMACSNVDPNSRGDRE